MNRRKFLGLLGIGAGAVGVAAVAPQLLTSSAAPAGQLLNIRVPYQYTHRNGNSLITTKHITDRALRKIHEHYALIGRVNREYAADFAFMGGDQW